MACLKSAFLLTAIQNGLRVSEITNLRLRDVSLDRPARTAA